MSAAFVDFHDVWLAYNDELLAAGQFAVEDINLQVREGEFIAIPVAGAYHLSMSSNYNGARRPEVLMVEEGKVAVMMRRETTADLLTRG